jgi:hypothetical protein
MNPSADPLTFTPPGALGWELVADSGSELAGGRLAQDRGAGDHLAGDQQAGDQRAGEVTIAARGVIILAAEVDAVTGPGS